MNARASTLVGLLAALLLQQGQAFSTVERGRSTRALRLAHLNGEPRSAHDGNLSRRKVMATIVAQVSPPVLASQPVVLESSQTVFKAGQVLGMSEAEDRLREGRKSAQYLLDNYEKICEGGGDNVRRYLGTVGTSSGLFGIGKVMITLAVRADDFVEYTELSNEVLKAIQQADGSAYMAIFVTTSTSQTPPSKYFGDAKVEIKRVIKALDELSGLIGVQI